MRTVWILDLDQVGLDANVTNALKRTIKTAGFNVETFTRVSGLDLALENDIVLIRGWNPEALKVAAMRDSGYRKVKLGLYLDCPSACDPEFWTYTPKEWQYRTEVALMVSADGVAVPSRFMANQLVSQYGAKEEQFTVVGGFFSKPPLNALQKTAWAKRPRRVLWPYSGVKSDNRVEFEAIRKAYHAKYPSEEIEWVAVGNRLDRDGVLAELSKCRVVISTRTSETWPTILAEASFMRCNVMAPNRLCYPEYVLAPGNLYNEGQAPTMLHTLLEEHTSPEELNAPPVTLQTFLESL